jgi:hypothetical protein
MVTEIEDEKIDLRAFLLDSDGTFITYDDKEMVMKKKITEHPDKQISEAGATILAGKNGRVELNIKGNESFLYYKELKRRDGSCVLL